MCEDSGKWEDFGCKTIGSFASNLGKNPGIWTPKPLALLIGWAFEFGALDTRKRQKYW